MLDPLGERKNSPRSRIVHRYPDRVLFLLTDFCSVYCRYCTRKHFTGQDQASVRSKDYEEALKYIQEAASALTLMVDHGFPVMNQMVLLNGGVNNHPAIVQALNRRLLYLRVKPYYMFQCDPSLGTDHLRTSIEESEAIQRELWGRLNGLAMANLSLDIPEGGGKVGPVAKFELLDKRGPQGRAYRGWDGG